MARPKPVVGGTVLIEVTKRRSRYDAKIKVVTTGAPTPWAPAKTFGSLVSGLDAVQQAVDYFAEKVTIVKRGPKSGGEALNYFRPNRRPAKG